MKEHGVKRPPEMTARRGPKTTLLASVLSLTTKSPCPSFVSHSTNQSHSCEPVYFLRRLQIASEKRVIQLLTPHTQLL